MHAYVHTYVRTYTYLYLYMRTYLQNNVPSRPPQEPKIKRDLEDIEEELREITRDIDEGRIEVKGTIAVTKYVDEKRVAKKKRQLEEELESISAASSSTGDEGDIHTSTTVTGSFDT